MIRHFALCASLVLHAGCASTSPEEAPSRPTAPVRAEAQRIDAVTGGMLVVPLDAVPLREIDPAMQVRLDDGRVIPSRLCRIGVSIPRPGPTDTLPMAWLPPVGVWTALELAPPNAQLVGGTAVVAIDPPLDAVGQAIWIGGVRHPVNWLPATAALVRTESGDGPWTPVVAEASGELLDAASPESLTPLGRWRYRLLVEGLRPRGPGEAEATSGVRPFADPVIEALARQNEDRWRVALAWLWAADPELCQRVKRRLAAVVDFGNGARFPAWPTDHALLDRLLGDLLDPALNPARRAQRAEMWLEDQPKGAAWIIDEGGIPSDGGVRIISVGVTNLIERETLCWAQLPGATDAPELRPLRPYTATILLIPVPHDATSLEVRAGGFTTTLSIVSGAIPAVPPGVGAGPLLEDLSMRSWLAGEVSLPRIEWSTSCMLHFPPPRTGEHGGGASWELFVECRLIPGVGSLERESVRVYLGPRSQPARVMRIGINGEVEIEHPHHEAGSPGERVSVARHAGGWSFRLPIPGYAIEPDGVLRLGVTRTDALGRRGAWPRAMLPWQADPARAIIDTRAWGMRTPAPSAR